MLSLFSDIARFHAGSTGLAILLSAALCGFAALQAATFGLMAEKRGSYLFFALTCLMAAVAMAGQYVLAPVDGASPSLLSEQISMCCYSLAIVAFVRFINNYTQQNENIVLFFIASLFSVITISLSYLEILNHPLSVALFLAAILLWGLRSATRLYRRGEARRGILLGLALSAPLLAIPVSFAAAASGQHPLQPLASPFFLLVLCIGLSLALDYREHLRAMRGVTRKLQSQLDLVAEADRRLSHLALHDRLTDLPNRTKLQKFLADDAGHSGTASRYGALLLFDLENFKRINDALGSAMGDRILREIADRLRGLTVKGGIAARLDGTDFAILLPEISGDETDAAQAASHAVERLKTEILKPLTLDGGFIDIGTRWGGVLMPPSLPNSSAHSLPSGEDLISSAQMALNQAKEQGRHELSLYQPAMRREANERLALESRLRRALEHDELSLCFQPQLDIHGRTIGAEALLRWNDSRHGLVPPSRFIPIAERTGLIQPIGRWVLEKSCEKLAEWHRAGVPFDGNLSINISPWQFSLASFEDMAGAQLVQLGALAERVIFEITEGAFLEDITEARYKMTALCDRGARFSIDDFGTGYSSLSYLQKLPVDELKIDQSFLHDLDPQSRPARLVKSIIDIGNSLDMHVLAEGVETEFHLQSLADLGCRSFQGYFLARPMKEGDFIAWLRQRNATQERSALTA